MKLTLYSTWGCHLCEQAKQLLLDAGLDGQFQVIDIIDDEQLLQRFRVHIPVVSSDKEQHQLLFWPFDLAALQQWLEEAR